jgi:DUF971 family protein
MDEPVPTDIKVSREKEEVTIVWNNGETINLAFDLLRNVCPCAECRGGHENMKSEPDEAMFSIPLMSLQASRLRDLRMVGNYAISITWEDGHSAGIYTWHFLYLLGKGLDD